MRNYMATLVCNIAQLGHHKPFLVFDEQDRDFTL